MRTWTLTLALLLAIAVTPVAAAEPASLANPLACGEGSFDTIFAADSKAAAGTGFSLQEPVNQQAPVCNPYCVTSQCSSHSECTAQPNGRCNFACPRTGCCVYN